jgi:hypothetical protein
MNPVANGGHHTEIQATGSQPLPGFARWKILFAVVILAIFALFLGLASLPTQPGPPSCPVPAGPNFAVYSPNGTYMPYPSNSSYGGTSWYNFSFVHCGMPSAIVSWLSFGLATKSCQLVSAPAEFTLSYANQSAFALENGTRGGWTFGTNTTVPTTGFLSIRSAATLEGDQLLIWIGGSSSPEGFPLAPGGGYATC